MSKMTLKTEGDRHVVVTRRFAAAPEAVYRAHTEPALIQKWLLGPDGWTMPVCINEARPGGKIRYEWTNGEGAGFYVPASISNWCRSAGSFMSSGCTCPMQRRTITSRPASRLTAPAP